MGRGDRQPTSTAIIANNFSPADQGRLALFNYLAVLVVMVICNYIRRCMCIKVHNDTLQATTAFHVSLTIHGDCGIAEEGRELCRIPNWLGRSSFLLMWLRLIGTSFLLSSAEYLLMSPPGLFHHMQCYSGSHWR